MNINDSNYEEIANQGLPIVLDFWATWCGPCKMISPIIEELSTEYEGKVVVGKVNIEDEAEDLIAEFGIRNVPTVLFIKDGEVVDKVLGAASKSKFDEKIKALL
ncbi:MAG: thioredoxin [Bacteroidaceae bacterium]|nr:thioredoxin [Bacteroidaceae bacterium]